jgi:hypothetical protein
LKLDKLSAEEAREMLAIVGEVFVALGRLAHPRPSAVLLVDRLFAIVESDQPPPGAESGPH